MKDNSVSTSSTITTATIKKRTSESKLLETSFPHNELSVEKTPLRPSNSCEGVLSRGVAASSTWPKHREYAVDDSELQKRRTHLMVDKTLQNDKRKSSSNPTVNRVSSPPSLSLPPAVDSERKFSTNSREGKDEKMSFLIDL